MDTESIWSNDCISEKLTLIDALQTLCVCHHSIYMYIYIYIEREREKKKKKRINNIFTCIYIINWPNELSVRQWSGRQGFNLRLRHTKDLKW